MTIVRFDGHSQFIYLVTTFSKTTYPIPYPNNLISRLILDTCLLITNPSSRVLLRESTYHIMVKCTPIGRSDIHALHRFGYPHGYADAGKIEYLVVGEGSVCVDGADT
jgi:hypothetical protein